MAEFKVKIDEGAWLELTRDKKQSVMDAGTAALRETGRNAVEEGRSSIRQAGSSNPLLKGLAKGLRLKEAADEAVPSIVVFHSSSLAQKFEHGGTIAGKPLLWIPTTRGAPPARRSGKKLVSATVRGQPMLFDAGDRDRHRRPLYVGVRQVRVPKRINLMEIIRKHVARFGDLFKKHFKED